MANTANSTDHDWQSNIDQEAEEYVQSIMASQNVVRVDTPVNSRKRQLSAEETTDSTVKKVRSSVRSPDQESVRSAATARRSLQIPNTEESDQSDQGSLITTQADVHVDADVSLKQLITRLSADMHMLYASLSERIDKLESGLEHRISSKVAQLLDKRVNVELGRIKKDVDARLDTFKETIREEVADDLEEINNKLSSLSVPARESDIARNVVIRNLPETVNENVLHKVNDLIGKSLRLPGVKVGGAVRKTTRSSGKPGVVIATMKSREDKAKVMTNKRKLKESRQHASVFIHHDQTAEERRTAANFKAIVDAVNNGNARLSLKGANVVQGDRRDTGPNTGPNTNRSDRDTVSGNHRAGRGPHGNDGRQGNRQNQGQRYNHGRQRRDH